MRHSKVPGKETGCIPVYWGAILHSVKAVEEMTFEVELPEFQICLQYPLQMYSLLLLYMILHISLITYHFLNVLQFSISAKWKESSKEHLYPTRTILLKNIMNNFTRTQYLVVLPLFLLKNFSLRACSSIKALWRGSDTHLHFKERVPCEFKKVREDLFQFTLPNSTTQHRPL